MRPDVQEACLRISREHTAVPCDRLCVSGGTIHVTDGEWMGGTLARHPTVSNVSIERALLDHGAVESITAALQQQANDPCCGLESISFAGCRFADPLVAAHHLAQLIRRNHGTWRALDLSHTNLDRKALDVVVQSLSKNGNLVHVDIGGIKAVDDHVLLKVATVVGRNLDAPRFCVDRESNSHYSSRRASDFGEEFYNESDILPTCSSRREQTWAHPQYESLEGSSCSRPSSYFRNPRSSLLRRLQLRRQTQNSSPVDKTQVNHIPVDGVPVEQPTAPSSPPEPDARPPSSFRRRLSASFGRSSFQRRPKDVEPVDHQPNLQRQDSSNGAALPAMVFFDDTLSNSTTLHQPVIRRHHTSWLETAVSNAPAQIDHARNRSSSRTTYNETRNRQDVVDLTPLPPPPPSSSLSSSLAPRLEDLDPTEKGHFLEKRRGSRRAPMRPPMGVSTVHPHHEETKPGNTPSLQDGTLPGRRSSFISPGPPGKPYPSGDDASCGSTALTESSFSPTGVTTPCVQGTRIRQPEEDANMAPQQAQLRARRRSTHRLLVPLSEPPLIFYDT